jgi:arginase family enzyme
MSTRLLIDSLHQIAKMDVQVVGADVVEINPNQDINGMTAMVGAKLLRELLGVMQDAD